MSKQAMQLALDALEKTMPVWNGTCAWHNDVEKAISALKEALAADEITSLREQLTNMMSVVGSVERERGDARRRADYWKAEHLAGNEEISACQRELDTVRMLNIALINNRMSAAEEHEELIELLEQATSYTCCSAYSPSLTQQINAALEKVGAGWTAE